MSEKTRNLRYALMAMLLCAAVQAQIVKGVVKDATGEAIIGATIQEKGTTNAAVTDFDGNFSIKMASTNHELTITYVGMVTQKVKPGNKRELTIVMEEDNAGLEELVVIGYTSKARKDLTGSVGSVSGAKLAAVPVTSAAVALQGKVSGVQVTTVDGQPGADVNIKVRGGTSVTQSNEPLYIVDGFQVANINDIPPSAIASIDIMKDASLTAIYGAKGGNECQQSCPQARHHGCFRLREVSVSVACLQRYSLRQCQVLPCQLRQPLRPRYVQHSEFPRLAG